MKSYHLEYLLYISDSYFIPFENVKIVIDGDDTRWIHNVSKWFDANYVLDYFHALKVLWVEFKPNNLGREISLDSKKFSNYQITKSYFTNDDYEQLIRF